MKMGLPSHGTGGEDGRRNASQFERARQSGALARYCEVESLLRGTKTPSLKKIFCDMFSIVFLLLIIISLINNYKVVLKT